MARNRKFVEHIHSNVPNKQPKPEVIELGELAVNTAPGKEFISLKNSSNEVIRLSSDEQLVTWMEKKTVMPYSGTVENIHLDTNRSNIEIKFNQVAAPNTNFNEKVNGALDIDGNEVNPSSDSGKTNGAGIAIDTSVFALTGGNPTFSSITTSCGAELRGTTEILGADGECGSELNVEVNNVTIQSTGGTTCISSETDANLYGAENTKVGISCDDEVSEKTYVKGESVVVDATDGKLGITAKEDIITSSEGSIIVTADDNACVNAGDATTIYGQNSTNIGVNCSGNDESLSTNIYGEDIDVIGGSVDIESTASTVCVKANTNASLFGNAKTLVGVSCNGDMTNEVTVSGSTININSTGNTNVKVNNFNITGDTIIDGTLDPKSGLSKTLKWEYGKDVRNASSGKTNFSGDEIINLPNSVSGLNRSTLTIKENGKADKIYDPGTANETLTLYNEPLKITWCGKLPEQAKMCTEQEYKPSIGSDVEISAHTLTINGESYNPFVSDTAITITQAGGTLTISGTSGSTFATSGNPYNPAVESAQTIMLSAASFTVGNKTYNPFISGESVTKLSQFENDLTTYNLTLSGHNDSSCSGKTMEYNPFVSASTAVFGGIKFLNHDGTDAGTYCPIDGTSGVTVTFPEGGVEPIARELTISGTSGSTFSISGNPYMPLGAGGAENITISAANLTIGDKSYNPFIGSGENISISSLTFSGAGACSEHTTTYSPLSGGETITFGGIKFLNHDGTDAGTYCPIDGTSGITVTFPEGGVEPTARKLTIGVASGNTAGAGGDNPYTPLGSGGDEEITISATSLTFSGAGACNNYKKEYNPFVSGETITFGGIQFKYHDGGDAGTYCPIDGTSGITVTFPEGGIEPTPRELTIAIASGSTANVGGNTYKPLGVGGGETITISAASLSIGDNFVYNPFISSGKVSADTLTLSGTCATKEYNPFSGNSNIIQFGSIQFTGAVNETYCPLSGDTLIINIPEGGDSCDKIDCGEGPNDCVTIKTSLCVSGDVTADAFYTSSDKRLKENICSISEEDLEKASKVELKSFNFSGGFDTEKKYGVIAQQVKEAGLDNLVSGKEEKGHYMSVDYTSLLILKIAELENKINALSEEIKELKKQ